MAQNFLILVVEDDSAIRRGLVDALRFAGYHTVECGDGAQAIDAASESSPDLVLLDVLLPGRTGFDILVDLRRMQPGLPVIMVTAKGAEQDRVRGLSDGADDYIVKPFSPRELLARVEAVLRRSPERAGGVSEVAFDGRRIDLRRREIVLASGERRGLSDREASIISYLASNRGRAVDRQELLHRVWGLNPKGITTRTVDMHIARLRDKVGDDDPNRHLIETVRSKGYMLSSEARVLEPARRADS
jgi:DNA-binding response OmpR family regulator